MTNNLLPVQEFLETQSIKDLEDIHGVFASFSIDGTLFSLNYGQIEARNEDLLAQDCRGLILAAIDGSSFYPASIVENGKRSYSHLIVGKTKIVAFPMRRFFNYGQECAAQIDFNNSLLQITTKMDGTLCIVYENPFTKQWSIATRSRPEADQIMDNGLFSFAQLYKKALLETTNLTFDQFTSYLDPNFTYCFELTSPLNRIVCEYSDYKITLLAARNITTLQEVEIDTLKLPPLIPLVKRYSFASIEKLVELVAIFDPIEEEGIVIKDANFNRIKLKNANYVLYSKVRDSLGNSERNCLELILLGKEDDNIPYLPKEIVDNLLKIKSGLNAAIKLHDEAYDIAYKEYIRVNDGTKKTFALTVQTLNKACHNHLLTAYFYQRFDKHCDSMKDFIMSNRNENGWSSSFLDKLLELSKSNDI